MQYIKQEDRFKYTKVISYMPDTNTPGELNFVISSLCLKHLGNNINYGNINEVIGVLDCAKLELYRKLLLCTRI